MFDPSAQPRAFAVPCGTDFGAALVSGLLERMRGQPPEAMARVEIFVNTLRMQRRVTSLFDQSPALLLPRIRLITSVIPEPDDRGDAPTPLSQKLALMNLVKGYVASPESFAPETAAFDLAESVAALLTEMAEEGVHVDDLDRLDVADQSGHWQRARDFVRIVARYVEDAQGSAPDTRHATQSLLDTWRDDPPQHPIVIAGSTGSRGPARMMMETVARLPQGALVLPGVDRHMSGRAWADIRDAGLREDHPQFRMLALCDLLDIAPQDLPLWDVAHAAPCPPRNALVSLALRPAPVTHVWRSEGPALDDLPGATSGITLIEAPSLREEALAIALRLRQAAEAQDSAALISPDRTLTRLVTAMLDQWGIDPDDSAGIPMHLTAPGRFLRHVTELRSDRLTAERLLITLKHPLCHSGVGRSDHLRLTRNLELDLRAIGKPFPDAAFLTDFAAKEAAPDWGTWLLSALFSHELDADTAPLKQHVQGHLNTAEALAKGAQDPDGAGKLWDGFQGRDARALFAKLEEAADAGPQMDAQEYLSVFGGIFAREQQRERDTGNPDIRIWGTLEARVMDADLLILGGLNEGSWPEAPNPDPWLNRKMRADAGLLLPERRIGLSAHDFQQAIGGKTVWLTRALRTDGAETVPSRWLNRLTNLLAGLETGAPCLAAMRRRGAHWLGLGRRFEAVAPVPPAPRPSPRPPEAARPRKLSVTQIKTLVRDPYAIYARDTLGLRPLEPLTKTPDPATRGTVFHEIMENFIQRAELSEEALLRTSATILAEEVAWPEARVLWQTRMERITEPFLSAESQRQAVARPLAFEAFGRSQIPHLEFELTAKADRIDREETGALRLYDYKTGAPPSAAEQEKFDKQLLLMAAMAEAGAFSDIDAAPVSQAQFLGLGLKTEAIDAPLQEMPPETTWTEFEALITAMLSSEFGFTARRAMQRKSHASPYDQLARLGEWDTTHPAQSQDVS
ncbi:double-strand break repair protein AddB [Roseobacteraceae bacterium S113]